MMSLEEVFNDPIDSAINAANAALSEALDTIKISHNELENLKLLKQKMVMMEMYPFEIQYQDKNNFNEIVEKLGSRASFIVNKLQYAVSTTCSDVHDRINSKLSLWKNKQKLAGNGYAEFRLEDLKTIQSWCDGATEMVSDFLNIIEKATNFLTQLNDYVRQEQSNGHIQTLRNLWSGFITSFERLIKRTFIIAKQPPQVMKTNTKFEAHLRLLVGAKPKTASGVLQGEVSAFILNGNQANSFVTNEQVPMPDTRPEDKQDLDPRFLMGNILGNTGKMKYEKESNEFSVTLKNMQLKKIKRGGKKDPQRQDLSVMDEKFVILFTANFKLADGRNIFASAISLPVTVIVHGNQEARAWATITWDNGFSSPERTFFDIRNEVSWEEAFYVMNMRFTSATGRSLYPNDEMYLKNKLIENQCMNKYSLKLSWSNFCKKKLNNGNFSFWDWFYAIMKLIEDRLKDLWKDGLIIGFISKENSEEMLKKCCNGTFLLRFSDSQLGKITTSYVGTRHDILSVNPYSSDELNTRPLPKRLFDEAIFSYLFPDIPKEVAFEKYNIPTDAPIKIAGYVPRTLREVVDDPRNEATPSVFMNTSTSNVSINLPAPGAFMNSPAHGISMNSPAPGLSMNSTAHSISMNLPISCDSMNSSTSGIFKDLFISSQSQEGSSQSGSNSPDSTHQSLSSANTMTILSNYQSCSGANDFDFYSLMEIPEDNPVTNSSFQNHIGQVMRQ